MSQESGDYKERYNKIYSENEALFGDGKPDKVAIDIVKHRTSGAALELGAGQGRNSLLLAQNGFEVTAQDISEIGIDGLKKAAAEKGLNIHAEVADVRQLHWDSNFDVLITTFMLHHLTREEALRVIKQMQEHTSAEGLNAIAAFTKKGIFITKIQKQKNFTSNPRS